jgi:hypothetical protein
MVVAQLSLGVLLVTACQPVPALTDMASDLDTSAPLSDIIDGTTEARVVLDFLNHPATTRIKLDVDVALDARAADSIIAWRAAHDGVLLTSDDRTFKTVQQVLDLPQVGQVSLQRVADYALEHAWTPGSDEHYGTCEGVRFTLDEAERTLAFANTAPAHQLDHEAGLDARAVQTILEARPLPDLETLADLPFVGPDAMRRLKDSSRRLLPPEWCTHDDECMLGSVCTGVPSDEEAWGRCVPHAPLPGEGERCAADADCGLDLVCIGEDHGAQCIPSWTMGTFEAEEEVIASPAIADDLVVHGLGPSALAVDVELDIVGDSHTHWTIGLEDPSGQRVTLWDGPHPPALLHTRELGIVEANGLWRLTCTPQPTAAPHSLRSWRLAIQTTPR